MHKSLLEESLNAIVDVSEAAEDSRPVKVFLVKHGGKITSAISVQAGNSQNTGKKPAILKLKYCESQSPGK